MARKSCRHSLLLQLDLSHRLNNLHQPNLPALLVILLAQRKIRMKREKKLRSHKVIQLDLRPQPNNQGIEPPAKATKMFPRAKISHRRKLTSQYQEVFIAARSLNGRKHLQLKFQHRLRRQTKKPLSDLKITKIFMRAINVLRRKISQMDLPHRLKGQTTMPLSKTIHFFPGARLLHRRRLLQLHRLS